MLVMADKKKPGRPPKHADTPPAGGRTGKALGIRIDPKLRAAVNPFIHAFYLKNKVRLDLTSTIELALTELFEKWDIKFEAPTSDESDPPSK